MHSHYSDGSLSPRELVEQGAAIGLRYMSITDHDELKGIPEAREAGLQLGVEVVPGIEISTHHHRLGLHILGYCFDEDHPKMQALVLDQSNKRFERARLIVEKLQDLKFELDFERIAEQAHGSLSQPLIVAALLENTTNRALISSRGQEPNHETMYGKYLGRGCPAYVPKTSPESRDAIELIHVCGGLAVLAHPSIDLWPSQHAVLDELREAGLDGVEVYSSNHDAEQTHFYLKYARRHGLLATGGSDFHGEAVPAFDLGSGENHNLDMGRELGDTLYERHQRILTSK